jgi:hypothetical protein
MVMTYVPGNMEHPGPELSVTTEQSSVFQNSHEHVLDEVFAQIPVLVHAEEKTEQWPFIPLKKQPKPVEVAILHPGHQGIVG